MQTEDHFYNCSYEYINRIDPEIYDQLTKSIEEMPKFKTQSEINHYLFKKLTGLGWAYDSMPSNINSGDTILN